MTSVPVRIHGPGEDPGVSERSQLRHESLPAQLSASPGKCLGQRATEPVNRQPRPSFLYLRLFRYCKGVRVCCSSIGIRRRRPHG